jgi:hypothetical protein
MSCSNVAAVFPRAPEVCAPVSWTERTGSSSRGSTLKQVMSTSAVIRFSDHPRREQLPTVKSFRRSSRRDGHSSRQLRQHIFSVLVQLAVVRFFYYWWGGTESLGICSSP